MTARDFGFLHGAWHAIERVRARRGADEWTERPAFLVCRGLVGGVANIEEITWPDPQRAKVNAPDGDAVAVITYRHVDVATDIWTISSHIYLPSQTIEIPALRGKFADGTGEFIGDGDDNGTSVRVRYVWSDITPGTATWTRSYSYDGGATWEVNIVWTQSRERTLA